MLLDDQIPRIQKMIREKMSAFPKNALQNDLILRSVFMKVHRALPRLIRITVSEAKFVEFCMANRDRLTNFRDVVAERIKDNNKAGDNKVETKENPF